MSVQHSTPSPPARDKASDDQTCGRSARLCIPSGRRRVVVPCMSTPLGRVRCYTSISYHGKDRKAPNSAEHPAKTCHRSGRTRDKTLLTANRPLSSSCQCCVAERRAYGTPRTPFTSRLATTNPRRFDSPDASYDSRQSRVSSQPAGTVELYSSNDVSLPMP